MSQRRELTQRDVERMQVPERYWGVDIEHVTGMADSHGVDSTPLRDVIENYVARLAEMVSAGTGILLHGTNGLGKTSALVVLALEARRRGCSVLYLETARLKRVVIDREGFDPSTSLWDRALDVDLLVLDDLGKGTTDATGFQSELLDELLRTRGARLRPTLISTNVEPATFVSGGHLKKSTLAMLQETTALILVTGKDLRAEKRRDVAKAVFGQDEQGESDVD